VLLHAVVWRQRFTHVSHTHISHTTGGVEGHIRQYNIDAYTAVVRAFSLGELSWAKDSVLTDLRKHLSISGEDESDIKTLVMRDERLGDLRNGRSPAGSKPPSKKQRVQPPGSSAAPSPAPSHHKKQQPGPSVPAPKKPAPQKQAKTPTLKEPMPHLKRPTPGKSAVVPALPAVNDLIGKRAKRNWEADGWCEAIISDYNILTGEHCLVYEYGTTTESWEWCVLDDLSPNEIIYLPGPKVNIKPPDGTIPAVPKGVQKSKKGGKAKTPAKSRPVPEVNIQKDKVEDMKKTIQTREQEILAQLNALSDSSDSDGEMS